MHSPERRSTGGKSNESVGFDLVTTREILTSSLHSSIYSFNVTEQSEVILDLLHKSEHSKFDIHSVELGPRVILVQGTAGPSDDWHAIALDVHTHVEFPLPPLTNVLLEDEVGLSLMHFIPCKG